MRFKNEEIKENEKLSNVEKVISLVTDNLKTMIDTKMVVGESINAGDVTLIPISKLSVGFIAGGGEYDKKTETEKEVPFAGGSGAGYSVNPIGFIVIKEGEAKLIRVAPNELAGKIIEVVPEVIDAINKQINKK